MSRPCLMTAEGTMFDPMPHGLTWTFRTETTLKLGRRGLWCHLLLQRCSDRTGGRFGSCLAELQKVQVSRLTCMLHDSKSQNVYIYIGHIYIHCIVSYSIHWLVIMFPIHKKPFAGISNSRTNLYRKARSCSDKPLSILFGDYYSFNFAVWRNWIKNIMLKLCQIRMPQFLGHINKHMGNHS